MINLTGGAARIEQFGEFDELTAAVAISYKRTHLAGEQNNPGQQAERATVFVLLIPRKPGSVGKSSAVVADGLDSGFSSQETVVTGLRGFFHLEATFFIWTSR
jgi:hypothetical protein